MTVQKAKEILDGNYNCLEGTLIFGLHEKSRFSIKCFWELYDSLMTLAKEIPKSEKDTETCGKIFTVCGKILKEMIWNFDENDGSKLEDFPKNYNDYIERLEGAADAYFRGVFIAEALYEMQRPEEF